MTPSAAELERMQAVQQESMIDTCVLMTATITSGAYGGQQQSFSDSEPYACGLSYNTARRMDAGRGPLAAVDAVLRLPLPAGAVLNSTSQIRITGRNGAVCTPQTFTIEGPIITGRTCVIVGLKRIGG